MTPTERKIREKIEDLLAPDYENIQVLYGPPPIDRSKEKELLSHCLFYKGEEECPYEGEDSMRPCYWDYERVWVEWELEWYNQELRDALDYLEITCPYAAKDNPDVPLGLQAIFVSRIERGGPVTRYSLRNFIKEYKQAANK